MKINFNTFLLIAIIYLLSPRVQKAVDVLLGYDDQYDHSSYQVVPAPTQPVPPPYDPPKDQFHAEPEIEKEVGSGLEGVLLTF